MKPMAFIDEQLAQFKGLIEGAILSDGVKGKESMIRSSQLINLIHDVVKSELIQYGIVPEQIYPRFGATKPEIKLAGFLKQKNQDVCVVPKDIQKIPRVIDWGPMKFQKKMDPYGQEYSENMLVINVRSQMSSLAKNADTLFERTFAEALNLHMQYPNIVLGEVYLIPTHEYDDEAVKNNSVAFKSHQTDVEKYISFFHSISGRQIGDADYMYERCSLLVVDFRQNQPRLFRTSVELKEAGIISPDFYIEYAELGFESFARDIFRIYRARHDLLQLM